MKKDIDSESESEVQHGGHDIADDTGDDDVDWLECISAIETPSRSSIFSATVPISLKPKFASGEFVTSSSASHSSSTSAKLKLTAHKPTRKERRISQICTKFCESISKRRLPIFHYCLQPIEHGTAPSR